MRMCRTFDGPTRAIRAAMAINDSARRLGLKLPVGLHIGECDVRNNSVFGNAVEFAQEISLVAEANEIVVSSTTKDLVAGFGTPFSEHSTAELLSGAMFAKLFKVER